MFIEPGKALIGKAGYLAVSICLSGDLFGECRFEEPLWIADRLLFEQAGVYVLVRAHRFNGYKLPDICLASDGEISLLKRYTYRDYYDHRSASVPA